MNVFRAQDAAQMTAVPVVSCFDLTVESPEPITPVMQADPMAIPNQSVHIAPLPQDLLKVPIA